MTDQPQDTLEQDEGVELDLLVLPDEDEDLQPQSLVYEDDEVGSNDEPVSAQLEPDDPDDRESREGPFVLPAEGEL